MTTIKTAISIDEGIFKKAEEMARQMKISRSQLFSMALEKYLRDIENKRMLEKINAVYEVPDPEEDEYMTRVRNFRRRKVNYGDKD